MLSEAERHRLVVEYNDTAADYPRQCVHELFAAQAARTPDAVAVVHEPRCISYGELEWRANQLAHRLRQSGIGPEAVVGLCVERSLDMVLGLLGILKAGGAYLPLDPSYPPERLTYMLADAQASVVVTRSGIAERLPGGAADLVLLDADWSEIARQPATAPVSLTTPDNLAYVIYTSGSTGRPKGVLVEHRPAVNYVWAVARAVGLRDRRNYLMVQPLSVDSSITVLYGALLLGGVLHLTSYEASLDSRWLTDYASRHPIDYLKIAPPHLQMLVDSSQGAKILPRERLIVGGDVSHWDWIDRIGKLSPQCRIFNHYGPTETTVGITVYAIDGINERGATGGVPIGRPLDNSQAYILDSRLQPVPVGVVGGLYFGGEPIVRGYHRRPSLTATSFMPDPFAAEAGRRLYRTGDRARLLPDGNIEFLGRDDDQVKIRGYRIELDEIANVLIEHSAVRQAVVVPVEGADAEKKLAAYVVLRESETPAALRRYLAGRLPGYMVPATLDVLDALPRTPHGKLDRRALPAPKGVPAIDLYVAPGTPTEATVAEIWGELLKRDRVSIDDDFFELGGHSLVATRVVARLRDAFDVELPLRALFEASTVRALADRIEMIRWAALDTTGVSGEAGLVATAGLAQYEGTL
jgi:amino acid adenylation domain-containing protein